MTRHIRNSGSDVSTQAENAAFRVATSATKKGESTMSKTGFAIIAGALSMALGVLTTSDAIAQEALFVTPDGNVGLGTSAPSTPLHVSRATGAILEGIRLSNNNEARIAIQNTNLAVKYFMAVNNWGPGLFFISREGGGGTIVEVNQRLDAGGPASFKVSGSVQATNVTFTSSRALKRDFQAVDPQEVLTRLAALPISKWRFKEGPEDEHLGPVAEDFHAAFGLGKSAEVISLTDTSGVALAAAQGLLQQVQQLQQETQELQRRNAELRQQNAEISQRLEILEKRIAERR